MAIYTKPQHRKKEKSERLRGEEDHIKFIDLRFERRQVVTFENARRQYVPYGIRLHLLGMNDDLRIIIVIIIKTIFIQANLFSKMNLLLSTKDL